MKTLNEMKEAIVLLVGAAEARKLVLEAYNAEVLANRLGRLEVREGHQLAKPKGNLLGKAVVRVYEVVTFLD